MKKGMKWAAAALCCLAAALGALAAWQRAEIARLRSGGNYSDEMKMAYAVDLKDQGAHEVERMGDHAGSPYFSRVDFYNAEPTKTLSILRRFQTIQQTTWWSCGVSCLEMVLQHYGRRGDWNEKTLAALRSDHSALHKGTCLDQMIEMAQKVGGFKIESTYDYAANPDAVDAAFLRRRLRDGVPVIVGWNDWGGHWQVIIGYDDMGTDYPGDDVIIVADPFDTTDHNQDGYGVYGAERFLYNFTFFDFFGEEKGPRDRCFLALTPMAR